MRGKIAFLSGILTVLVPATTLAVAACDLCTALTCETTEFEDYWYPALNNDPSLGLNWDKLNLSNAQRNEIRVLDARWKQQSSPDSVEMNPASKLQTLLQEYGEKPGLIVGMFKEIGTRASKSRENFQMRYNILERSQKETLQLLYKHREALQARNRVMGDIAKQDTDAGMVLGSKARKRVLCPYAMMKRSPAPKSFPVAAPGYTWL